MANQLSFTEKRILAAYLEFFGEKYTPSPNPMTDIHIKAQKMCYLLSRKNCDIVDTGFVWNTYGPFSVYLKAILDQLDKKGDIVQAFYNGYNANNILGERVRKNINGLKEELGITNDNSRQWIELLGSLSFLAHTEFPTSDYPVINSELKHRKAYYPDDNVNERAWCLLQKAGISY